MERQGIDNSFLGNVKNSNNSQFKRKVTLVKGSMEHNRLLEIQSGTFSPVDLKGSPNLNLKIPLPLESNLGLVSPEKNLT